MSECPEQWKLDVNDRYQAAVGVVSSLSTAAMVLPIFFLKDVAAIGSRSIVDIISYWAIVGWLLLAASLLSAIIYYYCSAKWVKLSWNMPADMFNKAVTKDSVEKALDWSFFTMMTGFIGGLFCMVIFMVTFHTNAVPA